jgi:cytochrome P450
VSSLTESLTLGIQRRPLLLRTLLGLARRVRPVLGLGKVVLVTGAAPAREVLGRHDDFLSGVLYADKLKLGPFILGMDRTERYEREKAALHQVLLPLPARLRAIVAEESRDAAAALGGATSVELVSSFVEPVMARAASRLYGVPLAHAQSRVLRTKPGADTLALWLRKLGALIGSSHPAPFGLEELADRLAPELDGCLRAAIAAARAEATAGGNAESSVLAELLRLQPSPFDDDSLVSSVGGLMLAGATVCKAFVLALHSLLRRPDALRSTLDAARAGDDALVLLYMWEALRFEPVFPLLARSCPRASSLGAGTAYATEVPAGATVVVALAGAMFDPEQVSQPDSFIVGRPPSVYLHLGYGLHACLGEQLAKAALPAMLGALLQVPGMAGAGVGTITYDGPAVDRYELEL